MLRRLVDWFVAGGLLSINPATLVKGPAIVAQRGKTPVSAAEEVRQLLDSIGDGHDGPHHPSGCRWTVSLFNELLATIGSAMIV